MEILGDERQWAEREFGTARLGNQLRTKRVVAMAATAVGAHVGTISGAFQSDAAGREGAYRLLEGQGEQHDAVGRAAAHACFKRAADCPYIIAPIDGTSLTAIALNSRSFGPIGNSRTRSRGINIMHAIGLNPSGTPLGVANQSYWTRPEVKRNKARSARRNMPFEDKETLQWVHVMERTLEAADEAGFEGKVWFQADRGADFTELLAWASMSPCWVTIRANSNRNVVGAKERLLWEDVSSANTCHRYSLNVPRGVNRQARQASLEIKFKEALLSLPRQLGWSGVCVPIYAVLVRETSSVAKGEEPIEWLLLTTKPIRTVRDAREVVKAYGFRWRIEECHKTWKSVNRVEDNQLKTAGALALWARILFSVSVRAERLKRLAREGPELPATGEFTDDELKVIGLKFKKTSSEMKKATMAQVIDWVARIGGYIGKSSGGPPGSITIGRGLDVIEAAVWVLAALRRPQ